MSAAYPPAEVVDALNHYKIWILFFFKKEHLRLESQQNTIHQQPIFITKERLLKIDCSSMCVIGMTPGLLSKALDEMEISEFLKVPETIGDGIEETYAMTAGGNLHLMQTHGGILKPTEYVDKKFASPSLSFRKLVSKIEFHIGINKNTKEISIIILDEILLNFTLVDEIRKFLQI